MKKHKLMRSFKKTNSHATNLSLFGLFVLLSLAAVSGSAVSSDQRSTLHQDAAEAVSSLAGTSPIAWFPIIRTPEEDISGSATGPIFGVNFINSAENLADTQQFQNGLATGAAWNRWPLYWSSIEKAQNQFDWSSQDAAVKGDVDHGLKTNAILLGTPWFYTTSNASGEAAAAPVGRGMFELALVQAAAPVGLYDSVFLDGTDTPGPGKQINPSNRWANFVTLAVNRYKPGGTLAQQHGWSADQGVTHWEMWNEPDLDSFWDSSLPDYARLLKVGYLAAKNADSKAIVLFAGLANNYLKPNYYGDVLQIYSADSLAIQYGYFHDIMATHNYHNSWQSWWYVYQTGQKMKSYGLDKPIWLNETGVAAWDDYPGPVWVPDSPYRATTQEQADFVIQTTFYAAFAGADAIFHFQLYDGCGNQPQGTNFPPHYGELCGNPQYPICAGDANGLFRNPTDAACYTQHPNPETKRPNFNAFKVLTTYFREVEPLWRQRPGGKDIYSGPQELIAFYKPSTQERVIGMWARFNDDEVAKIPSSSSSAKLIRPDGTMQVIYPKNGVYEVLLPGATNRNLPDDQKQAFPDLYPIGGRPSILIEVDNSAPVVIGSGTNLDGSFDLSWIGDDNLGSGIAGYDVSVSIDGGEFTSWIDNSLQTSAFYLGEGGHSYQIMVVARDKAGNVSQPLIINPGQVPEALNLGPPLIYKG